MGRRRVSTDKHVGVLGSNRNLGKAEQLGEVAQRVRREKEDSAKLEGRLERGSSIAATLRDAAIYATNSTITTTTFLDTRLSKADPQHTTRSSTNRTFLTFILHVLFPRFLSSRSRLNKSSKHTINPSITLSLSNSPSPSRTLSVS